MSESFPNKDEFTELPVEVAQEDEKIHEERHNEDNVSVKKIIEATVIFLITIAIILVIADIIVSIAKIVKTFFPNLVIFLIIFVIILIITSLTIQAE